MAAGPNPDAPAAPCRFEKVDQLKQEMRRKKELERRLRLGDASKGDEDAAEQDNVRRLLAAVSRLVSACSCGLYWATRLALPSCGSQHIDVMSVDSA